MKNITNKMVLAAAIAVAVVPALSAQTGKAAPAKKAPVKAEAPAKKAPAKPAPTLESVLSFLPDVLAEVGSKKLTKKEFIAQLASSQIAPQMLAQIPSEMLKGMLVQQINHTQHLVLGVDNGLANCNARIHYTLLVGNINLPIYKGTQEVTLTKLKNLYGALLLLNCCFIEFLNHLKKTILTI